MVGQAHTLDATAAARVAALRSSLFAATTPLSREPAFAGAGRCFKRGRRQHADGRLVSTRSCWCALARVATAAARAASRALPLHSGGAAAGVARHNPIPVRPPVGWRDAAMPCHSGGSARGVWSTGLSGRLPKFPSRSISGGRVYELPCHCGGTAAPLRRRCSPVVCDPPAPLAAAFPLPSAGARRARPPPPTPSCGGPPPVRGTAAGLAQARRVPATQAIARALAAEQCRHHQADQGRHVDADMRFWGRPPAPQALE